MQPVCYGSFSVEDVVLFSEYHVCLLWIDVLYYGRKARDFFFQHLYELVVVFEDLAFCHYDYHYLACLEAGLGYYLLYISFISLFVIY